MLSVSWTEIAVIVVLAIIFIKPQEFPIIMRKIGGFLGKVKKQYQELSKPFHDISEQKPVINMIVGEDGKIYPAYQINSDDDTKPKTQPD